MSEQKLGRYIVQDQLGEGSFAWVYKGYDEELDRHVAIKLLKPMWMADMNAVTRFKQEARTMAKLDHPNIAVVYEVGEQEGQVFLAQKLVDGNTLGARLAESGPLPWSATMDILKQIGSALDYAHSHEMIHRDIKPANILVDKSDKAFLGDFGLVRAAEGSASISASTGGMVGTPAYMAPEQWEGKDISPATDVYALSCVVFEMVTGRMLFNGETPATVMKQHLMEGPKFPDEWPASVPPQLGEVLKRGLAEESSERIQTAGELVTELEKIDEAETALLGLPWLLAADGQKYTLKPGSTTLGRGKNADIQIDRAMISRQHATVEFDGQQVTVYDEGSANGTFVNSERLGTDGRVLEFGDTVTVGDVNFVLGAPNVAVSPPEPAPEVSGAAGPIGATAQTMMGDDASLRELAGEIAASKESEAIAEPEAPPVEAEAVDDRSTVVLEPEPVLSQAAAVAPPAKKSGGKGMMIGIGVAVVLLIVAGLAGLLLLGGGGGDDGGEAASSSAGSESSGSVAVVDEENPKEAPTNTPVPPTNTPKPPTDTPEPEGSDVEEEPVVEEEAAPDVDELSAQAEALINDGQWAEAISILDQAIDLDPENSNYYDMRGYSYYNLGNYDEAIADYDQSLAIDPGFKEVHNLRGLAYLNNGDNEAALADFEAAIDLDSSNGDFHWNWAEAQENLGNYEEALSGYEAAVEAYQAADTDPDYYEEEVAEAIARVEAELGSAVVETEAEPTEEASAEEEEAQPTTAPAPTVAVASVSGHIAVPLMAGSEPRVYVVDTDGNLANTIDGARQPKHSLDGSKLVVNGDGGARLSLRMANFDGSNDQDFGDPNFNAHVFPTWSPDGKTVAYLDKFGTQEYHMFFRSADDSPGEGEEFFAGGAIFHANSMYPQWTNSGIFFRGCSTWNGQGGDCGTWLLSGHNGTVSKVTNNANHIPTDAAGNTGLFSLNEGGNWDVYKVDLNSGSVTQLTDNPSQDALGTISPDGNSVAFLSNRGGGLAVWRVGINGGEAEKLFDIQPDWGQLSNDGWSEETLSWGK